jgi:aspartate/tyrosine/aromatic aminotransferase
MGIVAMNRETSGKIANLSLLPADPIYGMQLLFKSDVRPNKCNLSIGVCQDTQGKTLRFHAVDMAEKNLHNNPYSKDYLPLTGLASFCTSVQELVCGKNDSVTTVQTVGGTGALYVASKLLCHAGISQIFVPDPTWVNHTPLFTSAGLTVSSFPYYDRANACIDFDALCDALNNMDPHSAVVLQASCHNPTGADLTKEQFKILSQIFRKRNLFPLFDLAYQGLGSGIEEDTLGIRIFLEDEHEMLVATTFAKSFGIYNERMGALHIAAPKKAHDSIVSHVRAIVRSCYSSPPAHGAHIINTILSSPELYSLWENELAETRNRLAEQRNLLYSAFQSVKPGFSYAHLMQTKGLFCLFDITLEQVIFLRNEKALYIANDGRICISAINSQNASIIAESMQSL